MSSSFPLLSLLGLLSHLEEYWTIPGFQLEKQNAINTSVQVYVGGQLVK